MAENQFVAQLVTDIFNVEVTCLRTDLCIECYVQQHISQLLANIFFVIPHQGITKFVSLFYSVGAQTFVRLLAVPRTFDPKLIEDVQTARAFGDLSENFEYKCAKQEKNRNDARIRYLQRMIKTARVIEDKSAADTAGLYDTVEIFMENLGKSRKIQLVTTLRQDALKGWISKESPVGRAVMGRKAGDRVYVDMGSGKGYYLQIRAIEKGTDNGDIPIGSF